MVRGLYASTSGALVAQATVDTIANNLANVDTAGFKKQLLQVQAQPQRDVYRFQTDPATGQGVQQRLGSLGSGAQVYDTPAGFAQGAIAVTGSDNDVALSGSGFFTIGTPQGVRYTRDGAFVRGANGTLTTQNGDPVLGSGGAPISLPAGKLTIAQDGTVSVDARQVDKLGIVEFANVAALRPEGANRFVDAGAGPRAAASTTALQGALEKSNADVVHSMVDLISAERWFDANEKSIQTQDDATALAIQTVGRSQ